VPPQESSNFQSAANLERGHKKTEQAQKERFFVNNQEKEIEGKKGKKPV